MFTEANTIIVQIFMQLFRISPLLNNVIAFDFYAEG
jgi:hypothetical protein